MNLDFVRGHMGGNLIILLRGDQIPPGLELEIAVKLMGPNYLHAHEAGILYPTGQPHQIEVKIVEPTLPCFISACGGFTQVLGAALIETELGPLFGIEQKESSCEVLLHTGCGPTMLSIESERERAVCIRTDMECFVRECYERGVEALQYSGVHLLRAGKFIIVNADHFKMQNGAADFVTWDKSTRDLLQAIQDQFMAETGETEPNVAVYDWHPHHRGDLRVVFPHYLRDDFIEPSCGTGSIALGLALLEAGELDHLLTAGSGSLTLNIESGGGVELGGPDLTTLDMEIVAGRVKTASFSHSRVEITAVGKVRI